MLLAVYDKVEGLQSSTPSAVVEVYEPHAILATVAYDVVACEVMRRLLQILNQHIGVHRETCLHFDW